MFLLTYTTSSALADYTTHDTSPVENDPLFTSKIIPLLYREIVLQTQRAMEESISSDEKNRDTALDIPAIFLNKQPSTFRQGIRTFFTEYLGFGDFIFRRPEEDKMAVIIPQVVGTRHEDVFYPAV